MTTRTQAPPSRVALVADADQILVKAASVRRRMTCWR